jgi:hypothetical protein
MAQRKLKVAEPSRSEEREALAAAIERHRSAVARQAKIEAAFETVSVWRAEGALERAAAEVEAAKARSARALFEEAADGMSVAEARAAHQAAQEALEAAQAARTTLEAEARAADGEIRMSNLLLDGAVRAVVSSAPATAALAARFSAVQREVADLMGACSLLEGGALPLGITASRDFRDLQMRSRWQAALIALRTNADAELPATELGG